MRLQDILERKKKGGTHSAEELEFLISSMLNGTAKDYHMSAWLMAVCLNQLTTDEVRELTRLMWKSGKSFPRSDSNEYWVDKHSTGGVGDKTSLILVPWVSLFAEKFLQNSTVKIPMVSGRGLGHTGGTLDKLQSIPGFNAKIDFSIAANILKQHGFFMVGQTEEIAPADKKLYALRDATSTVANRGLIVASIMSKKLAESPDGIVFDIKYGPGAFMPNLSDARALGNDLVAMTREFGKDAVAVVTRMNEPLGWTVGHFNEVGESWAFINAESDHPGLREVTLELAVRMVRLASKNMLPASEVREKLTSLLGTPELKVRFVEMFENQGGDWGAFSKIQAQVRALPSCKLKAARGGYLAQIQPFEVAGLLCQLGGARQCAEDDIDLLVGVEFFKKVGDKVEQGEVLGQVTCRTELSESELTRWGGRIFSFSDTVPVHVSWVTEVIEKS